MSGDTTIHLQRCLDRLQSGDANALEELIAAAADRLTILIQKMFRRDGPLMRWEETDDLAQGAVLRFWRALQDVQPTTLREFFRLAALQVRRELIDLARHDFGPKDSAAFPASKAPAGSGEISGASIHGDRANLSNEPSPIATWAELHELAGNLPEGMGEAFDLIFYQGLGHAEAAILLEVSTKTIQRRWQDACITLHKAMGGHLPSL